MRTTHSFGIFFLKYFLQKRRRGLMSRYINYELLPVEAKEKERLTLLVLERLYNPDITMSLWKMIWWDVKLASLLLSWRIPLIITRSLWVQLTATPIIL